MNFQNSWKNSMLVAGLALAGAIAFVAAANPQQAKPEDSKARKLSNVTWYEVRQVDFKPGKADEALKIIRDRFIPAAESAGLSDMRLLEYATGGRWDIQMIFTMVDGPSALEWEISPEDEKWMNALASQCGGMDKAEALLSSYRELISSTDGQLAFERHAASSKH